MTTWHVQHRLVFSNQRQILLACCCLYKLSDNVKQDKLVLFKHFPWDGVLQQLELKDSQITTIEICSFWRANLTFYNVITFGELRFYLCVKIHLFIDTLCYLILHWHYSEVIMIIMASQITSLTIVCSTICSGTDQRKHGRSTSVAFLREIHRSLVNSPCKGSVMRKMFPFDDIIMNCASRGLLVILIYT